MDKQEMLYVFYQIMADAMYDADNNLRYRDIKSTKLDKGFIEVVLADGTKFKLVANN